MEDEDKWFVQETVVYDTASHYIKTVYVPRHISKPIEDREAMYSMIINTEPLPKAEAEALCKLLHDSKPELEWDSEKYKAKQADAWRRYKELEWQETKLKIQININKLLTTVNQ